MHHKSSLVPDDGSPNHRYEIEREKKDQEGFYFFSFLMQQNTATAAFQEGAVAMTATRMSQKHQ